MNPLIGGCLCGATRYKISGPPLSQGICFCSQCKKAGAAVGSPLMVLSARDFECSQSEIASVTTQSDRGSMVTRYFCKLCGSHIFAEISDVPGIVTIRAATLDNLSSFRPEYAVWTSQAELRCCLPPKVPIFSGNAPVEILMGIRSHELMITPIPQDAVSDSSSILVRL